MSKPEPTVAQHFQHSWFSFCNKKEKTVVFR